MLTGIVDTDREILKYIEDSELLKVCSINKTFWNKICDDNFLRRRLMKYVAIEEYKGGNSWKRFFNCATRYIVLLKKVFDFTYTSGDFKNKYKLLKECKNNTALLLTSAERGDCELMKYAVRKDMKINSSYVEPFMEACRRGNLEIVKYLEEIGTDIHSSDDLALGFASDCGQEQIVKYLLERGANVHASDDKALFWAIEKGHLEVVKLLLEYGANINGDNNSAIIRAIRNNHLHIVKYLVENGANINNVNLELARRRGRVDIVNYLKERL